MPHFLLFISLFVATLAISHPTLANTFTPVVEDLDKVDFSSPPTMFEGNITSDGADMPMIMYKANGKGPHPTIILLHGFPGNEKNLDLAQAYRRAGFNVIFFHYRGAWGAQGEYGIANQVADTANVIALIRAGKFPHSEFIDNQKISLVGHSLGGFNALYSGINQNTQCTLAIAPTDIGGVAKQISDFSVVASDPYMSYPLLPLKGYSFVDALKEAKAQAFHLAPQMGKFKEQPILIVQGKQDTYQVGDLVIISPQDSAGLIASAKQQGATNASYLEMAGDHSFSWNRIALAQRTTDWLTAHCR